VSRGGAAFRSLRPKELVVPYEPPSGWVEDLADEGDAEGAVRLRFHASDRCSMIRNEQRLTAVEKPYSATRCPRCAAEG
jgi:hypothetical protein